MPLLKEILGYKGRYFVSDNGDVISMFTSNPVKLKKRPRNGYLTVVLYDEYRKPKSLYIHRLVAQAFIPNPEGLPDINHKDKNRSNNNVSNLEWCTRQYNNLHAHHKRVSQYDLFGHKLAEYYSVSIAETITGISKSSIAHCCNGNNGQKTAGGYIWRYTEEEEPWHLQENF